MKPHIGEIIHTGRGERFGAQNDGITAEIGFGNGEFLRYLAKSKNDSLVVGMEISRWCILKAARRAVAENLGNIRILYGDARYLLKYAFEPESISRVYMNFPCPWPKKRHEGRRVTYGAFAELLWQRLKMGGTFNLATDVNWYAENARAFFSRAEGFDAAEVVRNETREYVTKYERKWRAMGRDVYTLLVFKKARPNEGEYRVEDETPQIGEEQLEMSFAGGKGSIAEIAALLDGETIEGPGYIVVFRDVFTGGRGESLAKVISTDDGFEQHFYLKITLHEGKIRVRADTVGRPYNTPGVRASIRHAVKKLSAVKTIDPIGIIH